MPGRPHTDDERARAMELIGDTDLSLHAIHKLTGIPVSTLSGWAADAGVVRSTEQTADATKARSVRVASKREALREKLLDYAEAFADRAVDVDQGQDARALMTASAIALDKFRLESGESTEVHESRNGAPRRKVEERVDELASKRRRREAS